MVPGINLYYDYVIKENDKVIKKSRKYVGKSFVKGFMTTFMNTVFLSSESVVDITNTARVFAFSTYRYRDMEAVGGLSSTSEGIVVGTGTNAVDASDYKLQTIIASGVGSGQLQYGAEVLGAPTEDAASGYFVLTRTITNGSGGTITINEMGVYGSHSYDYTGANFVLCSVCLIRDVLVSPITLNNAQNVTINYTIKVTI